MERRNYLTTLGGIALTTQAGVGLGAEKVCGAADSDGKVGEDELTEAEKHPVYYTINIPAIEEQILHISIHADMLPRINLLRAKSESSTVGINLSYHEPESDDTWEVLNLSVQDEYLDEVLLGEVEGENTTVAGRWSHLEKDQIALLTTGTGTHGYLGVVGDGESVHVEGPENSWEWPSVEYERVRVETTDSSEIEITSGDEIIPVFEMDAAHLSTAHSR
jgi:hypothetical protein